jgi:hypothetical protein
MAFDVNTQAESVQVKLYTGLADFRPILINPTKEQLNKIGVNYKEEPSYASVDPATQDKKVRIDIWGEVTSDSKEHADVKFFSKLSFFLDSSEKLSSTGKFEYINEFGDTGWVEEGVDPSTVYNWYTESTKNRKAKNGEGVLIGFLKKYLSVGKGQIAKIDNINNLLNGDVKELAGLFSLNGTKKIQVLLFVKEYDGNYYQNVYSKYFGNAGSVNTKWWNKHLDGQTNNPMYQNSLQFKEFDPRGVSSDNVEEASSDSVWGS